MLKNFMTLDRPFVWLDCETHAFVQPEVSRMVDFGFIVIYPDDRPIKTWQSLLNPGVRITEEAAKKHGITNEMVADKPRFSQIAESLATGFKGVDYGGYNVNFDLRVLMGEMARAKVDWTVKGARIIDPFRLWQVAMPRTLTDAVREFLQREPTDAHRAMGDAQDALDVFIGQLERFPQLPRDVQKLYDLISPNNTQNLDSQGKFQWKDGEAVITFGKHKGTLLRKLDIGYLNYILKEDFPADVKKLAEDAIQGIYPTKESSNG